MEGAVNAVRELRRRADEDALRDPDSPSELQPRDPNRHRADLPELGLRVSLTRSRYPNRPDGVEMYAVTMSRLDLHSAPSGAEVELVLSGAFGDAASGAVERPGGGKVRMFRVRVG